MTRTFPKAAALALIAALIILSQFAGTTPAARAQTVIESATIENNFPRDLTFKLNARADSRIVDVTLSYSLVGRGLSALAKPVSFTEGQSISTEAEVLTNSGSSYIPAGSEFIWRWQITTEDGETFTSPDERFVYLPPDRDWKSVSSDLMVVYYHGERENLANAYLAAGEGTMQKLGRDVFGIELSVVPVNVVLFADESESAPARPGQGVGTRDEATVTCGSKVANNIVHVIPVSCGTPDRTDTLRHEFAHIINEAAGEGALGRLPSWLDEGTAVWAQATPGNNFTGAYEAAARAGRLIPFSQMGTPAADPNRVNLFYGQSHAMVLFLMEEGGPEQFAEFFRTIKSGQRFDQALVTVYGFDLAGFEEEFLAAAGSAAQPTAAPTQRPAQTQPTVAPTQRPAQVQPTRAPTSAPAQTTRGGDDDGPIDRVAIAAIGAAVLLALLAVFFFLLSQVMRSNQPPPPPPPPAGGPPINWGPPPGNS